MAGSLALPLRVTQIEVLYSLIWVPKTLFLELLYNTYFNVF